MTVEFGSLGFHQAIAEMLNNDRQWAEQSKELNHTLVFRYGPPLNRDFTLTFRDGKVIEPRDASAADIRAADFVISGDSDVWRKMFAGDSNPMMVLARGKIKVDGDTKFLVKNMGTFKYIIEAMGRIEFI